MKIDRALGTRVAEFRVTPQGMIESERLAGRGPEEIREKIIRAIVADEALRRSGEIALAVSEPEPLVRAFLQQIRDLTVVEERDSNAPQGLRAEIIRISPRLRRT